MRTISLRGLAILLLACSALATCKREGPGEADLPAGLQTQAVATGLPEGATVVVSGYDLESFWTRLQGSNLYKELNAIQGVREAFAPLAESQREFEAETGLPLNEATLMALFGQKFDLGFYGSLPKDRADLLFVADVKDEDQATEILESLERKVASEKGAAFSDIEVAGVNARVARNRQGEEVLFYALQDARLTMATTQPRLEGAIALVAGGGNATVRSMTSVEPYLEALRKLPGATIAIYVDNTALRAAAARATGDTTVQGERMRAATTALESYSVASSVAVGVYWTESGIRSDIYTRFPDGPRPPLAAMLAQSPGQIRSLAYQPVGTLLYVSINSLDAQTIYNALQDYAVDATRIQMGIAGTADSLRADSLVAANLRVFEQETGIDVENDIIAWIGREAAFSVAGVDKSGFFPLPEVSFTIAAKDGGRARAFLTRMEGELAEVARMRASVPLTWQSEEYQGQTIRFAPTPLGEGLSLAYSVDETFVLVASNRNLLKRMMDARAGRSQALPSNPEFASMTKFYPQEAVVLGFVNIEEILTQVQELMGTYGPMAGGGAGAADTTSTSYQVLNALKNAPRTGFYTEADEDGIFAHVLLEVR